MHHATYLANGVNVVKTAVWYQNVWQLNLVVRRNFCVCFGVFFFFFFVERVFCVENLCFWLRINWCDTQLVAHTIIRNVNSDISEGPHGN